MESSQALRDEFIGTLERVGVCPYCGDHVDLEPTDMCCGEVHGELGYETEDGQTFLESEFDEIFKQWQDEKNDPTPWCSACGAKTMKKCNCGPIPEND